ncbi:MAG: hypothetical protein WC716_06760 [Chitinophagaceae bacterium]|jgi:hypothetical protein
MAIRVIPKGLFKLKKQIENPLNGSKADIPLSENTEVFQSENSLLHNENVTVERFGFNSAKSANGSSIGLSICLNRIYMDHKKKVTDDVLKQAELKKPYRLKLHEIRSQNDGFVKRRERIKVDEINGCNAKIEKLRKDILEIRSNPERLTGDKSGKASFYIGFTILVFLTVYLFIFYSSASYSSFFKIFEMSETGLASSIFDPNALSNAYNNGITELVLIVTIPAVFLGLGFLIHKNQEKKGAKKILFIGSLVLLTFIFDMIIAYEICEKIYNIKKSNSFQNIPDYSMHMAFQSINFWLIIFAGFVVYLIWGFVFDFIMEAHEKLDKVRLAIKNIEEEIKSTEGNIDKLNAELNTLEEKENKNIGEINKLNDLVEHTTIIPKEFEQFLFHFMQGWLHWMSANLQNQTKQRECENVLTLFINENIKRIEPINI